MFHWFVFAIALASFIIPLWKILPRAGLPPALALVCLVPLGMVVLWWIVAFKRWPGDA